MMCPKLKHVVIYLHKQFSPSMVGTNPVLQTHLVEGTATQLPLSKHLSKKASPSRLELAKQEALTLSCMLDPTIGAIVSGRITKLTVSPGQAL